MQLEFSQKIFEKYLNFVKICPVRAELYHAGGRRHDEANSRFLQFCERA